MEFDNAHREQYRSDNQSNGSNHNNNSGYSNSGYRPNNGNGYNSNFNNNRSFYKKKEEPFDENNPQLYKAYVGTGNREAPDHVLQKFKLLATELEQFGYTARCGGFEGPEEVFELTTKQHELHLPWKGFNNKDSKLYFNSKQALAIAKMFHPKFDDMKPAIQAFLAKNVRMLLGKDLKSPAMFIICWSEDGVEKASDKTMKTGNLGHVLSIANAMKIPVFNFGNETAESRLRQYLELP